MANTVFKLRRSSVAGKKPTTSDIAIGEQALNLTDRILYSSDGTNTWEIGANNTTVNVTNSITVATNSITNSSGIFTTNINAASHTVGTAAFVANTSGVYTNNNITLSRNDTGIFFTPKAGGSNVGFKQQSDDNFVFYSTNTTNGQRAIFNVYANTNSNVQSGAFRLNVPLDMPSQPLYANGSAGSSGQVLSSNGSALYWANATGTGTVTSVATGAGLTGGTITTSGTISVNTGYDFTWTNNHTFSANVSVTGSGIAVASNTGSVYFGGITDANWRISRNAGITTKFFYTNNSLDIIAASSPREGIVFGWTGNSYLEVGYAGTYTTLPIYVGNSSVNTTINATSFTGTSNNSLYLGGTVAASYVQNTDSRTLSGNLTLTGANLVVSGTNTYITSNVLINGVASFTSINGQSNASGGTFTSNAYATLGGAGGNYLAFGQQTNFSQWIQSGYPGAVATYYNIILNPLGGNIGIGNTAPTDKLSVNGTTYLQGIVTATSNVNVTNYVNSATFSVGTAFTANATVVNAVTYYVGSTLIANSTGPYGKTEINLNVNNALTSNNSSYLGGNLPAYYTNATNITTGTLPYAQIPANIVNTTSNFTLGGVITHNANVALVGNSISTLTVSTINATSNGVFVGNNIIQVGNTSVYANLAPAALYIGGNSIANSTGANNAFNLGGTAASSYQLNSTLNANIAAYLPTYTGVVNGSSHTVGTAFTANATVVNAVSYYAGTTLIGNTTGPYGKTEGNLNVNSAVQATNSTNLNSQPGSYYTNATNITTGTLPYAQIPANVVNTTAAFTLSGVITHNANVVLGTSGLSANSSYGTAGQVLHSNGTATYWATDDQGVTSVATGNGLTGGPITTTGTVSVLANNGITANSTGLFVTQGTGTVVNATGVHVNSTYIGTLTANNTTYVNSKTEGNLNVNSAVYATNSINANNADYLDGQHGAYYAANSLLANYAPLAGATFSGDVTINANLVITGTTVTLNTATLDVKDKNITVAKGSTAAASDGAGITVDGSNIGWYYTYASNTWTSNVGISPSSNNTFDIGSSTLRWGTVYANNVTVTNISGNGSSVTSVNAIALGGKTEGNLNVNSATQATNATNLNSQPGSYYTNATNITTGTLPYAQIPANIVNTTAAFTFSGIHTHSANVVLGTSGLSANSSYGTAGQVLHSNGTATYWAADDQGVTSVATGNGLTGGTITATGTVSVLANNGITANSSGLFVTQGTGTVVNATGVHVNSAYVNTISSNLAYYVIANSGIVSNATGVHVNSTYIGTLSANNTTYVNGKTEGNLNVNSAVTVTTNTSTNTFTIGTASYFVANGNFGIGTSSPAASLDMGNANGWIGVQSSVTVSNNRGLTWHTSDPTNYGIYRTAGSWTASNYQQLIAKWATGIIIDGGSSYGLSGTSIQPSGGNVAIGAAASSATEKLYVAGNIKATGYIDSDLSFRGQASDTVSTPSFSWTGDTTTGFWRPAANTIAISLGGVETFRSVANGNIGIGTTTPAYKLQVNGSFAAVTKSFLIDHPSKPGMKLRHGSLEGPENGVYVRGKINGRVIELPDYWTGLVDEDTITVQLTSIGRSQNLYVVEVSNNQVHIESENYTLPNCYYTIYGERKDVEKLVVEF